MLESYEPQLLASHKFQRLRLKTRPAERLSWRQKPQPVGPAALQTDSVVTALDQSTLDTQELDGALVGKPHSSGDTEALCVVSHVKAKD